MKLPTCRYLSLKTGTRDVLHICLIFAGFIQYQWDGIDQHVRLSGIVRGLEYRNLVQAQNKKITGWGAHLSTVLKPVAPLKVYGAVNVGQGIGSLMNDLQNSTMDLIGKVYEQGQMYAPLSLGWYAGLQYNFSPKVFTTIMFGEMRFLPKHQSTGMGNDLYKYGLYGAANIFWYPTSRLALARNIITDIDVILIQSIMM